MTYRTHEKYIEGEDEPEKEGEKEDEVPVSTPDVRESQLHEDEENEEEEGQ